MEVLELAKERINALHTCDSAYIIAHAAWSACDHRMQPGPCAMEISSKLDERHTRLVFQLQQITVQPDFDNSDQAEMLRWLHKKGYTKYLCKQLKTTKAKLIDWE